MDRNRSSSILYFLLTLYSSPRLSSSTDRPVHAGQGGILTRHYPPPAELIYEWIMNGRARFLSNGPSPLICAKRGHDRKSAYSLRRETRKRIARDAGSRLGRSGSAVAFAWIYRRLPSCSRAGPVLSVIAALRVRRNDMIEESSVSTTITIQ